MLQIKQKACYISLQSSSKPGVIQVAIRRLVTLAQWAAGIGFSYSQHSKCDQPFLRLVFVQISLTGSRTQDFGKISQVADYTPAGVIP